MKKANRDRERIKVLLNIENKIDLNG